jgi:class 3 adenylate cyclase
MKKLLIIITLLFTINTAKAQLQSQTKIDSLLKELPKMKEDTNRVNLLAVLSKEYHRINPDEGIKYGDQGLNLSNDLKWELGVAKCLNSLGNNYHVKSDTKQALNYFKKALAISKKLKYKIGISTNLGNIGLIFHGQSNFPKALEYHKKALKIDEYNNNTLGIVKHLDNIGGVYGSLSDYKKALEYSNKALTLNRKIGNKFGIASNLHNIGLYNYYQSNYPKALEYFFNALKIKEKIGDIKSVASIQGIIAGVYFKQSNYTKAIEYCLKEVEINEKLGNKIGLAYSYSNIGSIYGAQSNYKKSLEYFQKSLETLEEIGNKFGIASVLGNIGLTYRQLIDYPKSIEYHKKAIILSEKIGNKSGVALNTGNIAAIYLIQAEDSTINNSENKTELMFKKEVNLNLSIEYAKKAVEMNKETGELYYQMNALTTLTRAYQLKGNYKKTLEAKEEQYKLKDSIFNKENKDKISVLEKAREDDVNKLKIEKHEIQLKAQEDERQLIILSAVGALLSVLLILTVIIHQRRKSEKLLLNVLPVKIAKRLKAKEHPIADHFDGASILFIDIVGFTSLSSDADPKRVVSVLNDIFTIFDKLADKHGLEKIKTIGDAYMAVAGIPEIQTDHSKRAAQMALDIKQEMKDFKTSDGTKIKFRIGIDCGAVVAGVIGEKKFIYDLWSDAVNTASRMESTGESGQIQITDNFKEELEKYEGNWNFILRGEFEIKGKGLMKTYFLEN